MSSFPVSAGSQRHFQEADFDALVNLIDAATSPERVITCSGIRAMFSAPGYNATRDMFVLPAADGSLLGARDVRVTARGDEPVLILESWGTVHPRVRGGTAAGALLEAAIDRSATLLAEQKRKHGVLQARAGKHDAQLRAALSAAGLTYARDLIGMERPTLDGLPEPELPEGIALRVYRPGIDDTAWVEAFKAAFSDHWGGFMGMNLPRWQHDVADPTFKPAISLVAWEGETLAGFCHGRIDDELNALTGQLTGMIRYVGVTPVWRKRGLGKALTLAGLLALRDAGMSRAVLGVDAENVTGARQLYERYGFKVAGEQVMYRRDVVAN
jgi:mycothiol synthase